MNTNILDFGAISSTATLSTDAFREAIRACTASGGGYVDVPAGDYLTGTIRLEDNVILRLSPGSRILGSPDFSDYSGTARGCSWCSGLLANIGVSDSASSNECKALIVADRKKNCGIIGNGVIDGQRSATIGYTPERGRPFLVVFSECQFVTVRDVTLTNAGMFTFYGLNSSDVNIDGVIIRTADCANGDGLDFDGGKRVSISNCSIDAGDDAIGLKTLTPDEPCEDFTITNCHLRSKHWGAVRIGPESAGDMRRIHISNCSFYDCGDGFKLQLTQNATFEDFCFENITMRDVLRPIFITVNRYNMSSKVKELRPQTGTFRRVQFANIIAHLRDTSRFPGLNVYHGNFISAIPGARVEDVTLQNVHMIAPGGGSPEAAARTSGHGEMFDFWNMYPEHLVNIGEYPSAVLYLRHAAHIRLSDCTFECTEEDPRPAIVAEDVEDISVLHSEARRCGGLLRHWRCAALRVDGNVGDIRDYTSDEAAAYDDFAAASLSVDRELEASARLIDKLAKAQPVVSVSSDSGCEMQYKVGEKICLLIPNIRSPFAICVNGTEVLSRRFPAEYDFPLPFAAELTPYLVAGNNKISVVFDHPSEAGVLEYRLYRE